jgi:TatD DNase family protein
MEITWFDSHCHVLGEEEPAEVVFERARNAGVTDAVVLGTDPESSRAAIAVAQIPGVHAGAAWHPTSTQGWQDGWIEAIGELVIDDRVVAVGETGLDLYWDRSYLADQERAFRAHIELAKATTKALVIHTRESVDEAATLLEEIGPPERLVFHCWSGDTEQLRRALALGAFISFAGNVSFRNAEDLREAAREVPDDRLLIETDAPYLAPVPKRGKRNEPAFVIHTGEAVAAARGTDVAEIAALTSSNARRLFGL